MSTDASVQTVILYDNDRMAGKYAQDLGLPALAGRLSTLVADPKVCGVLIDLAATATTGIRAASCPGSPSGPAITTYLSAASVQAFKNLYAQWDASTLQQSPPAANVLSSSIKQLLLYHLAQAFPNLKYLVIAGGDSIIPFRRIVDTALRANEDQYGQTAGDPAISSALANEQFLSDDYYANLLPLIYKGQELYLPQLASGRLVEAPSKIGAALDAFQAEHGTISPANALVTGYDFLTNEAWQIQSTLSPHLPTDTLISDTWTAKDFRNTALAPGKFYGLLSLNSHFRHYDFYPNDPANPTNPATVAATEIGAGSAYSGSLVFSVGCHSGLNVPDGGRPTDTDWPQAFLRQGATFIGNTGYGYADSSLIAYSADLMTRFVGTIAGIVGPHTAGDALLQAKENYFGDLAAGTFSDYDQKAMNELTYYGLPMLAVSLPAAHPAAHAVAAATPHPVGPWYPSHPILAPRAHRVRNRPARAASSPAGGSLSYSLANLSYAASNTDPRGTAETLAGTPQLQPAGGDPIDGATGSLVVAGRPVQPKAGFGLDGSAAGRIAAGQIAHGVLMEGGTFADTAGFNPIVANLISEQVYPSLATEPTYPLTAWFPTLPASLTRFPGTDGLRQRLVVVPGQFSATSSAGQTTGTERLYTNLQLSVLTAPDSDANFVRPTISNIRVIGGSAEVQFAVAASTVYGTPLARALVLYAPLGQPGTIGWTALELALDSTTGLYEATAPLPAGLLAYVVQVADRSRNVQVGLDHGNPYVFAPLGVTLPPPPTPFVTPHVAGTQSTSGFYTGDVSVTWGVDAHGAQVATSGCGPSTLTANTTGTTLTCIAGSSSATVTITIDRTPPLIQCAAPDGQWHAANASLACTATDAYSGLASAADAGFSLSTSVPDGTEMASARTVCNVAGLCATAGPLAGIKVDRAAPSITISSPMAITYAVHQQVFAGYSCADGGSGLAGCAGPVASGAPIDTSSPGSKSFAVHAADAVGNGADRSVAYTVGYRICPLFQPITIPFLRRTFFLLQLCDAAGANLSPPGIVLRVTGVRSAPGGYPGPIGAGGTFIPVSYPAHPELNFYALSLNTAGYAPGTYLLDFAAGSDTQGVPVTYSIPFVVR